MHYALDLPQCRFKNRDAAYYTRAASRLRVATQYVVIHNLKRINFFQRGKTRSDRLGR